MKAGAAVLRRFMLRRFEAVHRLSRRFRSRFTGVGYMVLSALGIAMIIGINARLSLASQIFTLLSAIVVLGLAAGVFFRPRISVTRRLPPFVTAGETARYTLDVVNSGDRRQAGLYLHEELRESFPTYEEFVHSHDPADRYRNAFDRLVGFPKWTWLAAQKRGAVLKPVKLPVIPAHGRVEASQLFVPLRRGFLHWQTCSIVRPDPFGVVNAVRHIAAADSLLVLPKRYPIACIRLPGNRLYQPGGVVLAASSGDTEEFISLRDYRPGDSLRHIHWKSWAKVTKPIVKEHRPEYFARYALILDTFAAANGAAVFEEAVSVAASFVASFDLRDVLIDLIFVGARAYRFTGGRGLGGGIQLLKILACVEAAYAQTPGALHDAVLHHASQFSGCVLVLLDWDDQRRRLVQNLRARAIKTLVLVVSEGSIQDVGERGEEDFIELPIGRIAETLANL